MRIAPATLVPASIAQPPLATAKATRAPLAQPKPITADVNLAPIVITGVLGLAGVIALAVLVAPWTLLLSLPVACIAVGYVGLSSALHSIKGPVMMKNDAPTQPPRPLVAERSNVGLQLQAPVYANKRA